MGSTTPSESTMSSAVPFRGEGKRLFTICLAVDNFRSRSASA
jgi:hypothetical protein